MKIPWFILLALPSTVSACIAVPSAAGGSNSTGEGGQQATGGVAGRAGEGAGNSNQGGSGGAPSAGQSGSAGETTSVGGQGGGGQSGQAGSGGLQEPPEGPCGKVSEAGVCLDAHTLQRCLVLTGQGQPQLVTQTCPAPKVCAQVGGGDAACFLDPSLCEPGSSRCLASDTRADCDESGHDVASPCPSCKDSALGPSCKTVNTTKLGGALDYEYRVPNEQYTDWGSSKYKSPAVGLLATSWHKTGTSYEPLDSTILDENGAFSLEIASPPGPEDLIVFSAVRPSEDGKTARFAVAEPAVGDGQQDVNSFVENGSGTSFWSWQALVGDLLGNSSGKLTLTEASGSAVAFLFDYLRYVYQYTEYLAGTPGDSLVVWIRPNTSWSCGTCFLNYPTTGINGVTFQSQIVIPALKEDQSFWSGAVNAHELGHWVMASYGFPAQEGGPHTLNCSTYPGQAWSEGWATGFSSLVRGHSVYYDKQDGSFFWLDITPGSVSPILWPKPSLDDGLYQQMSENEVASILWSLATKPSQAQEYLGTSPYLLDALRSSRMLQAPFLRGYQQHLWDISPGSCAKENVQSYPSTVPMLADYLDALACNGFPTATMSSALKAGQKAGQGYPYDPTSPLCK